MLTSKFAPVAWELKYLAVVESALNPNARSRMGATGLWQFMYQTGKLYNLEVSSYIDERSDPFRATEAACMYLENLYQMYGDWSLALAAYNSGPGNVSKAIRRSGGSTNYWNIRKYLPSETAAYVPAFYATLYIFEYAKEHNLKNINLEIPKNKFVVFTGVSGSGKSSLVKGTLFPAIRYGLEGRP
ncbi:MAG: hypothetical protein B7Z19_05695, partial [Polynucleobacter sp. 32-46-5]